MKTCRGSAGTHWLGLRKSNGVRGVSGCFFLRRDAGHLINGRIKRTKLAMADTGEEQGNCLKEGFDSPGKLVRVIRSIVSHG